MYIYRYIFIYFHFTHKRSFRGCGGVDRLLRRSGKAGFVLGFLSSHLGLDLLTTCVPQEGGSGGTRHVLGWEDPLIENKNNF